MASKTSTSEPGLVPFYSLSDPFRSRSLRLETFGDPRMTIGFARDLARGRLLPDLPVRLRGYMGSQLVDVLWSGIPDLVCISSRVLMWLREANTTGWTTYPVEVCDRRGNPLSDYHGFAVTGPTCRRDRSRSQIVGRPPITPGGTGYDVYLGLYFDESQWDGSDFFRISHGGGLAVTNRVYQLLERHRTSNIELKDLSRVEIPVMLDQYEHDESE
jgi:hypothetical protein